MKSIFYFLFVVIFPSDEDGEFDELPTNGSAFNHVIKYNMRKSLDLDQEGCYLETGKKGCLRECGFSATAKTIFIIHGWAVRQVESSCNVSLSHTL